MQHFKGNLCTYAHLTVPLSLPSQLGVGGPLLVEPYLMCKVSCISIYQSRCRVVQVLRRLVMGDIVHKFNLRNAVGVYLKLASWSIFFKMMHFSPQHFIQ